MFCCTPRVDKRLLLPCQLLCACLDVLVEIKISDVRDHRPFADLLRLVGQELLETRSFGCGQANAPEMSAYLSFLRILGEALRRAAATSVAQLCGIFEDGDRVSRGKSWSRSSARSNSARRIRS